LDATDNVETRYLINDICVKLSKPWVYGGAIGVEGIVMPVVPEQGPCLRCIFENPPSSENMPTPERQGILNVAPLTTAALQVAQTYKIVAGEQPHKGVITFNLWTSRFRTVEVDRNTACPCCAQRRFDFVFTPD
jgi:adenylyltransferase/sulfurtransferase